MGTSEVIYLLMYYLFIKYHDNDQVCSPVV